MVRNAAVSSCFVLLGFCLLRSILVSSSVVLLFVILSTLLCLFLFLCPLSPSLLSAPLPRVCAVLFGGGRPDLMGRQVYVCSPLFLFLSVRTLSCIETTPSPLLGGVLLYQSLYYSSSGWFPPSRFPWRSECIVLFSGPIRSPVSVQDVTLDLFCVGWCLVLDQFFVSLGVDCYFACF